MQLCCVNIYVFVIVCCLFLKINKIEKFFQESYSISLSNCLDLDQNQQYVSPDLGPDRFQRLSASRANKERVNYGRCTSIRDSSRNPGMTEKKPSFIYS